MESTRCNRGCNDVNHEGLPARVEHQIAGAFTIRLQPGPEKRDGKPPSVNATYYRLGILAVLKVSREESRACLLPYTT